MATKIEGDNITVPGQVSVATTPSSEQHTIRKKELDDHMNADNPHGVTAEQAGADPAGTAAALAWAFDVSLHQQAGVGDSSLIRIHLHDGSNMDVERKFLVRVRLCDEGAFTFSGANSIAPNGGSQTVEVIEPGSDLVIESDANGVAEIALIHADTAINTIRIGHPPVGAERADYTDTLDAAPLPAGSSGSIESGSI